MKTVILDSKNGIRLRSVCVEEYVRHCTPWYQDEELLRLCDLGAIPYDAAKVRRMYEEISKKGEVYLIEIGHNSQWKPVGDASLLEDGTPIIIGEERYRSRGIGTVVLNLLLARARAIGLRNIKVGGALSTNERSLRMYRRAGFRQVGGKKEDSDGNSWVKMEMVLE